MTKPHVVSSPIDGAPPFTITSELAQRIGSLLKIELTDTDKTELVRISREYMVDLKNEQQSIPAEAIIHRAAKINKAALALIAAFQGDHSGEASELGADLFEHDQPRSAIDRNYQMLRSEERRTTELIRAFILGELEMGEDDEGNPVRRSGGERELVSIHVGLLRLARASKRVELKHRAMPAAAGIRRGAQGIAWTRFVAQVDDWASSRGIQTNPGRADTDKSVNPIELNPYLSFIQTLYAALPEKRNLQSLTSLTFRSRVREARK